MPLTPEAAATLVYEIFDLQRAVRCISASISRQHGTGAALHFVLRLVGEEECRATELAARLGIGAPILSRHITELEDQGLVTRKKDPADGRAQLVAITPHGAERLHHLETQRSAAFQNHLWNWNEEDAMNAAMTLHQLTQALTAAVTSTRRKAPTLGRIGQNVVSREKSAEITT
jgi:DNA-binding MarR family transcriptional regulator